MSTYSCIYSHIFLLEKAADELTTPHLPYALTPTATALYLSNRGNVRVGTVMHVSSYIASYWGTVFILIRTFPPLWFLMTNIIYFYMSSTRVRQPALTGIIRNYL